MTYATEQRQNDEVQFKAARDNCRAMFEIILKDFFYKQRMYNRKNLK